MIAIPDQHAGLEYSHFLAELSQKRRFKRYLEVGIHDGRLLSLIRSSIAIGVDPDFKISYNVAAYKQQVHLFNATSDEFFSAPELMNRLGGAPDFAFLDGYHTFEFLLRDFMNTEAVCTRASTIGMHDCMPLDDIMTERNCVTWQKRTLGSRYEHWWTGDVWKMILILKRYRPDLRLHLLDCPPTGVVCVTRLDPNSNVLREKYLETVEEFIAVDNNAEAISDIYRLCEVTPTRSVLNELDHSLFFVT